jgi:hypothetical protein
MLFLQASDSLVSTAGEYAWMNAHAETHRAAHTHICMPHTMLTCI